MNNRKALELLIKHACGEKVDVEITNRSYIMYLILVLLIF